MVGTEWRLEVSSFFYLFLVIPLFRESDPRRGPKSWDTCMVVFVCARRELHLVFFSRVCWLKSVTSAHRARWLHSSVGQHLDGSEVVLLEWLIEKHTQVSAGAHWSSFLCLLDGWISIDIHELYGFFYISYTFHRFSSTLCVCQLGEVFPVAAGAFCFWAKMTVLRFLDLY